MDYGEKVGKKELTEEQLQKEIQNRIRLGKVIRQARKAKQLTTIQLGELVNVSGNYIALVERGEKNPSDGFIREVSNVLDLDENELFAIVQRVPLSVIELIENNQGLQILLSDISKANLNNEDKEELIKLLQQTFDQFMSQKLK